MRSPVTSTSVATKGAEDAAKPRRQGPQAIVIAREIEVLSRQTRTRELCRQTVRSAQINASPVSLSNDNGYPWLFCSRRRTGAVGRCSALRGGAARAVRGGGCGIGPRRTAYESINT